MKTLIFGCKGQLGRDLMEVFRQHGTTEGVDLPETDIADTRAVASAFDAHRPDAVLNAAAYTDVEAAEGDSGNAFRVNETGARTIALAAASRGTCIVYYSTDYVFGGRKRDPYLPGDALDPIGVYARSKAAGEAATRECAPRHFILRTAWLFGPGGNNFVEKILRAAATRPTLRVVEDEVGSPTYTHDLAEATAALCATDRFGTYHAVNAGSCSRFEFAREILRLAGLNTKITPCASTEFPMKAPRPAYSVLSNEDLERATGYRMRPWQEALAGYMKRRANKWGQ